MTRKEMLILIFSIIEIATFAAFWYIAFNMPVGISAISSQYIQLMMFGSSMLFATLISYMVLWFLTAKDIKEKRISWAHMILPIILGGIGGIIYLIVNRSRGPGKPAPAVAQRPEFQSTQQALVL